MGRTLCPYPHKPAPSWDSSDPSQDEWSPCAWPREVGRVGASEVFLGKINYMKSCRKVEILGHR